MPHKSPSQSVQKKQRDEAGERSALVASRRKSRRADTGVVQLDDDDDIIASVDLDAAPEGDGPDA